MGRASISIAITSSYNAKGVKQAQESVRKLTANLVALRGGVGASDIIQGSKLAEASGHLDNLGKSMQKVGDTLTKSITVPTTAAVGATVAATAQIDTAWYNVRKTVEATEGEYQRLRDGAIELSKTSPVSAETILNVEGLGGQLGITNEYLEDFSKTVTGLDIATDMDAETAAMQLAQFMNITKTSQGESSNLGSTIVDLGNKFATTESNIMNMATRLASAGDQAGMSEAEILGISTALSSMGMRAEAGGSAMSRVINDINSSVATGSESLNDYAEVAGMSAEEFAESWRRDAAGTFADFVAKLGEAGEATGSTQVILDRLGISEIRTSDAMRRLAGNSDLVKRAIDTANTAFEENTALSREVDERNKSVEARFGTLKNQVIAAADSFGGPLAQAILDFAEGTITPLLQNIEDVGKAFADMPKSQQQMIIGFGAAAAAAGPLLKVGGKIVQGMGKIVNWAGKVKQSQGILKSAMNETSHSMLDSLSTSDDATVKIGLLQNSYVRAAGGIDNYVAKSRAFIDAIRGQAEQAALAEIAQDRYEARVSEAMQAQSTSYDGAKAASDQLKEAQDRLAHSLDGEADAIARSKDAQLKAQEANRKLNESYKNLQDAHQRRMEAVKLESSAEERRAKAIEEAQARHAEAVQKAQEAQAKLSDAMSRAADAQKKFVDSSLQVVDANRKQAAARKEYNAAVQQFGQDSDEARAAQEKLAEAMRNAKTVNADYNDSFKDMRKAQEDARDAQSQLDIAMGTVKTRLEEVADSQELYKDAAQQAEEAIKAEQAAQEAYNADLANATSAQIEAKDAKKELSDIYREHDQALKDVASAEKNAADAGDAMRQATEGVAEAMGAGVESTENMTLTAEEAAKKTDTVSKAMEGVDDKVADFVGSGDMAKTALEDVGEAALNMGEDTAGAFKNTQTGGAKMAGAIAGSMSALGGKIKAIGSTIGATLTTMLPMVAIAAVVGGITAIVGHLKEAAERTEKLEGSIKGIDECSVLISRSADSWKISADGADQARQSYAKAGDAIKEAAIKISEGNDALVSSIGDRKIQYQVDVAELERAGDQLLDLAGTTEWTETTSARFADTLSKFNSVAGTSWEVVEGTNGVIKDQNGVIVDLAAAIEKATEARRKDMEMQAYEENWNEAYKNRLTATNELAEAQAAYAANQSEENRKRLDEAQQQYDASVRMEERTKTQMEAQDVAAKYAEKSIRELIGAEQSYADAIGKAGDKSEAFVSMIEGMGLSTEQFASLGSENIAKMAQSFDGSFDSMIRGFRLAGIDLNEFGVSAANLVANSESFASSFKGAFDEGFGNLTNNFSSAEDAMSAFGGAVEKLGYRTTDLASLTPEQLRQVAASFDGTSVSIIDALNDLGIQLPELGSIAAQNWAQGIDGGAAAAIEAAARAKNLTLEELNGMGAELGQMGNGAMLAFAAAISDGSVQAGMSADQVKEVVRAKMEEMDLKTITDDKVNAAIRAIAEKSPEFAAAIGLDNLAAEEEAKKNETPQIYLDKSNQAAENASNPDGVAAAQEENNAAQESAAEQNQTPEIVDQKTQEAVENASDPAGFEQSGAENAQSTAEGYQSVDITGPVNEAVRSALADALSGNTDGARETGRALGEGIVEGIANADVSTAGQTMGVNLTSSIEAIDVSSAGAAMGQRLTDALAQTDLTATGQTIASTLTNGFNTYDFGGMGTQAGMKITAAFDASMLVMAFSALAQGTLVAAQFTTGFNTAIASFDASAAGWALANSVSAGVTSADYFTPGSYAGQATVAGFSAAATSAFAPGLALGSTFTAGVSAGAASAPVIASGLSSAAGASFGAGASGARAGGSALGLGFVTALRGTAGQITAAARTLSNNAATGLRSGTSAANSSGKSVGSAFASGIQSMYSSVASAARALSNAISAISSNNWRARGWGQEAGQNFANGLWDKVGAVQHAAQALAAAAAGPLHHSTPDYGPLVDDDKWGGEMVANIVDSMNKATPSLARAASKVSATMAEANNPYDRWVPYGGDEARAQVGKTGDVYNITIDGRMVEADPALKNAVNGLVSQVARRANMGR